MPDQKTSRFHIDIFNLERLDKGNLKAFVDIKIGRSIRIYGFRVIQQPNQKPWVSPPQRSWQDPQGKTHYAPIIEVFDELKQEIEEAVMQSYHASVAADGKK